MKNPWEEIWRKNRAAYCGLINLGDLEIQRLYKENCQLREARIKAVIDAVHKSAAQWRAVAEKLAEYLDKMCDAYDEACETCPLYNCEISFGSIKQFVIHKARKELGYE